MERRLRERESKYIMCGYELKLHPSQLYPPTHGYGRRERRWASYQSSTSCLFLDAGVLSV